MPNRQEDKTVENVTAEPTAADAGLRAERKPANADTERGPDSARATQAANEENEALKKQQPPAASDDPGNPPETANSQVAESRGINAAILH